MEISINSYLPILCSSFKLKKLVTKATRGNNILDQAYSTLSSYYGEAKIPLGLSDHSSVLLEPLGATVSHIPTTRVSRRVYKPANKSALFTSLGNVNWTPLFHLPTCEEQFEKFQTTITYAMDTHLPLRQVKLHPTDKPWFTYNIKLAIVDRQRA